MLQGISTTPLCCLFSSILDNKDSLVGVLSLCKHISLQLREVALLVTTLANPHVQQVGVYGCVVSLQQSALNSLSCGDT